MILDMDHPSYLPSLDHDLGRRFQTLEETFATLGSLVDSVEEATELDQELPRSAIDRAWAQGMWALSALDHGQEARYRRHRRGVLAELDELRAIFRKREVRALIDEAQAQIGEVCRVLRRLKAELKRNQMDDSLTYIDDTALALMTGCVAARQETPEGVSVMLPNMRRLDA